MTRTKGPKSHQATATRAVAVTGAPMAFFPAFRPGGRPRTTHGRWPPDLEAGAHPHDRADFTPGTAPCPHRQEGRKHACSGLDEGHFRHAPDLERRLDTTAARSGLTTPPGRT